MPAQRRRGPYKRYLRDANAPLPRTSAWHRRREELEANVNNADKVHPGEGSRQELTAENINMMPKEEDIQSDGNLSDYVSSVHSAAEGDIQYNSRRSSDSELDVDEQEDMCSESVTDSSNSGSYSNIQDEDSSSEGDDIHIHDDDDDDDEVQERNNEDSDQDDDDNNIPARKHVEVLNTPLQPQENEGGRRDPLYDGAHISTEESDMLIMSFIIRWGLQDKAIEDLLQLLNCHMPVAVLGSKDLLLQKFPVAASMKKRYFCLSCSDILDLDIMNGDECPCGHPINLKELQKRGNSLVQLNVAEQIQKIMGNDKLVPKLRKECAESDVISGKVYKRLRRRGVIGDDDISLQWNTDGVTPFESSQVSFWPIQACINELPYQERKGNMLLCGLYYGKAEPEPNAFLKPFINDLNQLRERGIECNIPGREQPVNVKVHCFLSSVDSVVRPMLQGLMQFNGRYGCSFCVRKGRRNVGGKGYARIYHGGLVGPLRSLEQHTRALTLLENYNSNHRLKKEQVQGVVTGSVLLLLSGFDITKAFVPEYLHSVLEGVVDLFWRHWRDSDYERQPWYLTKGKQRILDQRLQAIRPPVEVTRVPRKKEEVKEWKASELRSFLVYYSLVCLTGLLPVRQLRHWFLFVYAMTTYLRQHINHNDFMKAKSALEKFVTDIAVVYPDCPHLYTFSVHLLLHIPRAVENFGALWASSTFPYEQCNSVLTRLITGTQGEPTQFCRSFLRLRYVAEKSHLVFDRDDCSVVARELYKSMLSKYGCQHSYLHTPGLRLFGVRELYMFSPVEKVLIQQLLGEHIFDSATCFSHMILHGSVYHTNVYGSVRNNSFIKLSDGTMGEIKRVLLVKFTERLEKMCVLICELWERMDEELCQDRELDISSRDLLDVCHRTGRVLAALPDSIHFKCVSVPHGNAMCLMPLVNTTERD